MLNSLTCSKNDILDFFRKPKNYKISKHYTNYNNKDLFGDGYLYLNYKSSYLESISSFCCFDDYYYLHNEDGPAFVMFYETGKIFNIKYYYKNKINRFNKPASIYYNNNLVFIEIYYHMNKIHNSIGPAHRIFSYNRWVNNFYLNNKIITKDDFFRKQHNENYQI